MFKMENYSSIHSILFSQIIESIRRNEHGILDFIVQDIMRDRNLRSLINREIETEKKSEDHSIRQENGMIIKIDLSRDAVPENDTFRLYLSGSGTVWIDWGDGTPLEEINLNTSDLDFYEHRYEITDNYIVTVYGQEDFPEQEISFGSGELSNYYNRAIEEIVTWGDLRLVSLSGALSYTDHPLKVPNELPLSVMDLSCLLYESTVPEVSN